ncbi:MAG: OadG family protein [Anaerovoracaceae bacterium]|jgi:sodium pump decarboxylase gamma subunit
MEDLTLMQKFADPQLIDNLSMVERTEGALITTLMGMGITFIVLALLWVMIALMTKAIQKSEHKPEEKNIEPAVLKQTSASSSSDAPALAEQDAATQPDTALIAVIAAAIAAVEGSSTAENLVIKRIKRISGTSTAWSKAGAGECIDSRKF